MPIILRQMLVLPKYANTAKKNRNALNQKTGETSPGLVLK